jgi:hypothetical protein
MIAEALKYMHELGEASTSPIVQCNAEPSHVYFRRRADGTFDKIIADGQPRANKASSLTSLIALARNATTEDGQPAEIWHHRNGAVLLVGEHRRDRVTFDAPFSTQLVRLMQLEKDQPAFKQDTLIKLLRVTFRESLVQVPTLIGLLRQVKFSVEQRGQSEVQHGKVSIGKTLDAEITGTGVLPEYVRLGVTIYAAASLAGIDSQVECALEPDAQTQTFQLIPLPGSIERAIAVGEEAIRRILAEEQEAAGFALYHGTP